VFGVDRVFGIVKQLSGFRLTESRGKLLLQWQKDGGILTREVERKTSDLIAGLLVNCSDKVLIQKLLLLCAAYDQIEKELLKAGVIASCEMGCNPVYDLDPGTGCLYVPTPFIAGLRSMLGIRDLVGANKEVEIADLGSGLGLPVFLSTLLGFCATGFELSPVLMKATRHIKTVFPDLPELGKANFIEADFFQADLSSFKAIYTFLWDNALREQAIEDLISRMPSGTVVCGYGMTNKSPNGSLLNLIRSESVSGRKISLCRRI